MAFNVADGTITLVADTMGVGTTIKETIGFAPKLIIFRPRTETGVNENEGGGNIAIGAWSSDGFQGTGLATTDQEGIGTSDCSRTFSDTKAILMLQKNTGGIRYSASVTADDSTSFTITIDVDNMVAGISYDVDYTVYGGADFQGKAGMGYTDPTSVATDDEDFNWTGDFEVEALMLFSALSSSASEANVNDVHSSWGFWDKASGNTFCIAHASNDNQATSETRHGSWNNKMLVKLNPDGGLPMEYDIAPTQPTTGFRLRCDDPDTSDRQFLYIAMRGINFHVAEFIGRTTNGDITSEESACGFKPNHIYGFTDGGTAFNNKVDYNVCIGHQVTLGKGNAKSNWVTGEDAQGTTDTSNGMNNEFLTILNENNSKLQDIAVTAYLSNGFRLNQSNSSGAVLARCFYMAMGDPDATPGAGLVNGGLVNNNPLVMGGGVVN
jgi:hypothetical protein